VCGCGVLDGLATNGELSTTLEKFVVNEKNDPGSGLFSGLRGIIGRKSSVTVETPETFLPQRDFEEVLAKERSRTDRGGPPFVMLLITVCAPRESESFQEAAQLLAAVLSERTRGIDTKGWFGEQLGLILPQTSAAQANVVWSHLEEAFRKKRRSSSETTVSLAALKSEIYTYPSDGKHNALNEALGLATGATEK